MVQIAAGGRSRHETLDDGERFLPPFAQPHLMGANRYHASHCSTRTVGVGVILAEMANPTHARVTFVLHITQSARAVASATKSRATCNVRHIDFDPLEHCVQLIEQRVARRVDFVVSRGEHEAASLRATICSRVRDHRRAASRIADVRSRGKPAPSG
jgi:hypothetical protein